MAKQRINPLTGRHNLSGDTLGSQLKFTRTFGALSAGATYPPGTEMEKILRDAYAPYVPPVFTTRGGHFANLDGSGVTILDGTDVEVGRHVKVTDLAWDYTLDSEDNPPNNIIIAGAGFQNIVRTGKSANSDVVNDLMKNVALQIEYYTITGKDKNNAPITPKVNYIRWANYSYIGAVDEGATINEALIKSMSKTFYATPLVRASFNLAAGKIGILAYPASGGNNQFNTPLGVMSGSYVRNDLVVRTDSQIANGLAGEAFVVIKTTQSGLGSVIYTLVNL